MNQDFRVGCLVRWTVHDIFGVVEDVEHRKIAVALDTGDTHTFAADGAILEHIDFRVGSRVTAVGSAVPGVIVEEVFGQEQHTWLVSFLDRDARLPERSLRPAEIRDPVQRMKAGQLGKAFDFNLKSVAADLWTQHLHNELVSLAHARVDLKPHQVGVVHRVITNYPHRFLLCDEVGLGKTIEAAMIIKELKARGHVRRVLVLVPSGLQRQWQFELKTKFNETFAIYNRDTVRYLKNEGEDHPWAAKDQIIASHTWASWSEGRREEIASIDWDLIVVDEAHHARQQRYGTRVQRTNLYRLVRDLVTRPEQSRRAALFLTATPMQLQRHELYSLVDMLDPILFSSEEDFVRHIQELGGLSPLVERIRNEGLPQDPGERVELAETIASYTKAEQNQVLQELDEVDLELIATRLESAHRLSEVLMRNRRAIVGGFQPRRAFRWPVTPTELELTAYRSLEHVLAEGFRLAEETNSNSVGFLMTTFQRLATSSTNALLKSLSRRIDKVLATDQKRRDISLADAEEALDSDSQATEVIDSIASDAALDVSSMMDLVVLLQRIDVDSKARALAHRLNALLQDDRNAKVLVFTQFRETQAMLAGLLRGSGWEVHLFHGQLNPIQKDQAIEDFKNSTGPQILISTEAGGEGRNLQFCHLLVNYDLPWNPMKVEQRIGRVDRIGQEHPVVVFNLFVEGTIEERVLDVLEHRINLFTEAVGGLEPIIGEVESDIRKAIRLAGEERDRQLERLAERTQREVERARKAEQQMADLILDSKSYGAEIARKAMGADEIVSQEHYELFLKSLLRSANTYIEDPDRNAVHKIHLHPPLSIERPDLIDGRERRRVCFNPRQSVDSELVEYLGFGHPLVDHLTESRINEYPEGAASIRYLPESDVSGWQFNWIITIGSVRTTRQIHPIFVRDGGPVDALLGVYLLDKSRHFEREDLDAAIDLTALESAHRLAQQDVGVTVAQLERDARMTAESRGDEERARVEALHDHRKRAAADRLESARTTLDRLEASDRPQDIAVVPLWRANVDRAAKELEQIDLDRNGMLADIARRMRPSIEYELLNVARIVGGGGPGDSEKTIQSRA